MGRFLAVSIALLAVLSVIWFCCGNGAITVHRHTSLPQFSAPDTQPQSTQPPQQLPSAQLRIGSLVRYEEENIAALQLYNEGHLPILRAEVMLRQGDNVLYFAAGYIPPGGAILVQEKYRKEYSVAPVDETHLISMATMDAWMDERVLVQENGFALTLTNLTDAVIKDIRVYYKQYDHVQNCYIGGVTYSLVLPQLQPGESKTVSPYLYDEDHTKVVAVTAEK